MKTREAQGPENIEKNLKEFCVDMESLCEKYEKEIGRYKKNLEEFQNNNKSNARKSSSGSQNDEKHTGYGVEKCDASMNTDDLSVDDVKEILVRIDNNLIVENKSNF